MIRRTNFSGATTFLALFGLLGGLLGEEALAQPQPTKQTPESTESWEPVPPVVTPGVFAPQTAGTTPPSDALVLFDGSNTGPWLANPGYSMANPAGPLAWPVRQGVFYSATTSSARTKQEFGDIQLHLEFQTPAPASGNGQNRGNSGIFLQGRYELQVLDSYNNPTYVNGMVGSFYKQAVPLVNPSRKPGEWQSYEVIYTAPRFTKAGMLLEPPYATVLLNGVLVQNHVALTGTTEYIGYPRIVAHGKGPILLQNHNSPVGFRNIWVREL